MLVFGLLTTILAISLDTSFYTSPGTPITLRTLVSQPIITPLNSFLYNSASSNLALHGTHPFYQHLLGNLPQLLGPASLLLFLHPPRFTLPLISAISGILVLSLYSHQEARFLIPTIPLILSSVRLPASSRFTKPFLLVWIAFNAILGLLMGVYHQGGVVPTQLFLSTQPDATQALWWRTYSPPIWLLDGKALNLTTTDLQGAPAADMLAALRTAAPCLISPGTIPQQQQQRQHAQVMQNATYLIAPSSSTFLDSYTARGGQQEKDGGLIFERVWEYRRHLNLDDLDFAGETGVWGELGRVIGRRGLRAWRVSRNCISGS
jgi:phosphatidylinositol glycan class Z